MIPHAFISIFLFIDKPSSIKVPITAVQFKHILQVGLPDQYIVLFFNFRIPYTNRGQDIFGPKY